MYCKVAQITGSIETSELSLTGKPKICPGPINFINRAPATATMCDASQDQRARRIPDQEWDAWREKLVRLYVGDSLSRNEIIEIMAKEHGFVIK
jgi:hypothetical protein